MSTLRKYTKDWLMLCGLNEGDMEDLERIIEKMEIPVHDLKGFYESMESAIPFEGGMGFSEALIGAKISLEDMKTWKK